MVRLAILLLALPQIFTTPYLGPAEGPKATVHLVNGTTKLIGVAFYKEPEECRHRLILKPMLKGGQDRTVNVPTNGEVSLTVSQDNVGVGVRPGVGPVIVGCNATLTFQAQEGSAYDVRFDQAAGVCRLNIVRTGTKDGPLPAPEAMTYRARKWVRPMGEAGPFCRD
jgi:hypothetical protein